MNDSKRCTLAALLLGGLTLGGAGCATAQEVTPVPKVAEAPKAVQPPKPVEPAKKSITIKRFEGAEEEGKERTWLGVGLCEPDETLCSQLGLKDGVGLVVSYVVEESPAAKAGLQKNDVLLEMEGQTLVVPAQLQKLVQTRKEGDKVTLKLLRGGKKDSVTATLGKTKSWAAISDSGNGFVWSSTPGAYAFAHAPGAAQAGHPDHMLILEKALKDAKIDQERVKVEVKRSMEEARKAMEEALKTTRRADGSLKDVHRELEQLARARVFMPNDATVVVRSTEKSSKSMVKADDTGTIVLVKNPRLRLTVHDQDGKMLFDGEIETQQQREKIPADLLKKVEPMLEEFSSGDGE